MPDRDGDPAGVVKKSNGTMVNKTRTFNVLNAPTWRVYGDGYLTE
jgi:hypothetical protein